MVSKHYGANDRSSVGDGTYQSQSATDRSCSHCSCLRICTFLLDTQPPYGNGGLVAMRCVAARHQAESPVAPRAS